MPTSALRFFALVFAISVPIWLIQPPDWPLSAAVVAPLVAASILSYREARLVGVRRLLRRVADCDRIANRIWYLPVVLLMPLLSVTAYGVMRVIGLPLESESFDLVLAVPAFFGAFFLLAIAEEVGWTGYATDPLQARRSALATALILGAVSALWHLVPLIVMGRSPEWIAWWAVWSIPLRVFFIWVYNNTSGSVFATIVLHAMVNLCSASPFVPRHGSHWDVAVLGVITVIAAALVTFLWGWRTLARFRFPESPALCRR